MVLCDCIYRMYVTINYGFELPSPWWLWVFYLLCLYHPSNIVTEYSFLLLLFLLQMSNTVGKTVKATLEKHTYPSEKCLHVRMFILTLGLYITFLIHKALWFMTISVIPPQFYHDKIISLGRTEVTVDSYCTITPFNWMVNEHVYKSTY